MKHVVAYWTGTGEPILDTDMDYFEDAYEAERWLTYMRMGGFETFSDALVAGCSIAMHADVLAKLEEMIKLERDSW